MQIVRMSRVGRIILCSMMVMFLFGCGSNEVEEPNQQEIEGDADGDADAGGDADGDSDADGDADADGDSEYESPCPDGLDEVDNESDCLIDDAYCEEVDGVWCTGPAEGEPVLFGPDEALETDQDVPLTFVVDGHAGNVGGELQISVVSGPNHGILTPTEGTPPLEFTYTPDDGFYGDDEIELQGSSDDGTTTDLLRLSILVRQVNTAPEITSIPNQVVAPSGSTGPLEFTVTDAETAAADLAVSAESLDPSVLPQDQITLGGSGENRTIEVEAGEEFGTVTVVVTVSDGDLETSTEFDVRLTEFCPLMTYDCATGCCPAESHVVSQQRGSQPFLDVDDDDNVYITFAHPSSTAWGTGLTVYTAETGEWDFFSYSSGNPRPSISVAPTGRVHHSYARDSGAVYYQYSDDQGQSWIPLDGIPGTLRIGGACTMSADSDDDPHLICGMDGSLANQGIPRHITWDGSQWNRTLADFHASIGRQPIMHMGFADRMHVVHTYGPTDSHLHYSYETTDQWLTEAVPIPDGYRTWSADRRIGFILADNDEVHIAVGLRSVDTTEFQIWYGVRTIDPDTGVGEWNLEVAIPNADMAENIHPDVSLDLDDQGTPVIMTNMGTGAFRDASGQWNTIQTEEEVYDVAAHNGKAYIVFPVAGQTYAAQRVHLSVIELTP